MISKKFKSKLIKLITKFCENYAKEHECFGTYECDICFNYRGKKSLEIEIKFNAFNEQDDLLLIRVDLRSFLKNNLTEKEYGVISGIHLYSCYTVYRDMLSYTGAEWVNIERFREYAEVEMPSKKELFSSRELEPTKMETEDLVGAMILDIGFVPHVEGGLTIDYLTKEGSLKRIVLGFTELGMWINWKGKLEHVKSQNT